MTKDLMLVFLNACVLVSGQFLWKSGLMSFVDPFSSFGNIMRTLFSPLILSGIVLYGFATVLWLYIVSRVPLSVAYPIQSIAYVLAVIGSHFIFNEPLSPMKIGGVLLIIAGVSLIGFSSYKMG